MFWLTTTAFRPAPGGARPLPSPSPRLLLAALLLAAWLPLARADLITNVMPVNVTPSSFSILWRAGASTPSMAVFADANGTTNLAGKLGIEAFPLHTGNPSLPAGYDRRQSQALLRQQTQGHGLMLMRVSGCRPGTTYYYRLTSTPAGLSPVVYPPSGPLPSVTTGLENSFVINDQQLIIDVPGLDTSGCIVTLSNAAAPFCLAAVVGDGAGTNQAFFNLNDLLAAAGAGNFTPLGSQLFAADILEANGQADTFGQVTVTFGANLTTAAGNGLATGYEFVLAGLGSAILQTGQSTNVVVSFDSSTNIVDLSLALDVPPGHLTNLVLQGLAPEIDPLSATVTLQGGERVLLHLATRSGQFMTGSEQVAQLAFTAIAGAHSAFVPLTLRQITATKAGAVLATNLLGQSGRAVVIGPEALLEGRLGARGARSLNLYAKPFASYALEYTTNFKAPVVWTLLPRPIATTSMLSLVSGLDARQNRIFYRAVEFVTDPPILEAMLNPDGTRALALFGKPGYQYTVLYSTDLSNIAGWYPLVSLTFTGSAWTVNLDNTNAPIFYRLQRH